MNLDELAQAIREVSDEDAVQRLADLLVAWKATPESAAELGESIERYIGHSWIPQDDDRATIYRLWSTFRQEAIEGIGGMTMNERLHAFGLFERFENAPDEAARLSLYRKLHAKP